MDPIQKPEKYVDTLVELSQSEILQQVFLHSEVWLVA